MNYDIRLTKDLEEDVATQERLKVAVHYTVGKLCEYRESEIEKKVSKHFMAALSDIVYKQAEQLALDLECFAKHAKRSTISVDDVKLCARRNSSFYDLLLEEAEKAKTIYSTNGPKKEKTKSKGNKRSSSTSYATDEGPQHHEDDLEDEQHDTVDIDDDDEAFASDK